MELQAFTPIDRADDNQWFISFTTTMRSCINTVPPPPPRAGPCSPLLPTSCYPSLLPVPPRFFSRPSSAPPPSPSVMCYTYDDVQVVTPKDRAGDGSRHYQYPAFLYLYNPPPRAGPCSSLLPAAFYTSRPPPPPPPAPAPPSLLLSSLPSPSPSPPARA